MKTKKGMFTAEFITVFLMFVFFMPLYATAQEEKDTTYEIQELVITGTRTYEKIIDIPYSVFRVDKKELKFGKKVSAQDVLADVPGLFLQSRFGNHDVRISIRGFGARSNSGIRGIRILQDGIPESEPDGETVIDAIDFTALGGVEVAKGNLSSLYSNAPGGVVNFITDLYFPSNYVSSVNQGGKYGFLQNGFKLGLKSNDNRFFLSYNYRNLNGFREHSNEFRHLVNSVYEGYVGQNSTISIFANYVNGINKLPGSLTQSEFDTDPFKADPLALSQDYRRESKKGRIGLRYKTSFGKEKNNELEFTGFLGVKNLIKTDQTNYTISDRFNIGGFTRWTNRSLILGRDNTFTTGFDVALQNGPTSEYDNIAGSRGLSPNFQSQDAQNTFGAYFLDMINVYKSKMELLVSGRYDYIFFSKEALIFNGLTDTTRAFNRFTPKIALNYKLTPNIALYSSYGIGFEVPYVDELNNNNTLYGRYTMNPDLKPQTSNNFEFGIKGNILRVGEEFMRKVYFEATYFNYVINDEIVPYSINNNVLFRNAAKTNRQGIEFGFMSIPLEELELTINYTYTTFKYDSYIAKIYTPEGSHDEDYSGNVVPAVPQHIFNFIINYEFELSENINGLLNWDCDYLTKMFVDDKNSQSTSPYFYGNAMAGLNFVFPKWNALVFTGVSNIFDKRYTGYLNINDFGGRYYSMGEPRNFYAGINFGLIF